MPLKTALANTKECLDINFKILTIFGVWSPSHYIETYKAFFYKLQTFLFVGICLCLFIIVGIVNIFTMHGDMESIANGTFLMLTHLAHLYKTVNVILRRERIGELIDTLDEPLFNEVDVDTLPRIRSAMISIKTVTLVFMGISIGTIILWGVFPFLDEEVKLPVIEWSLFDTSCSPNFEIVFTYEILATVVNAISNICMDTLFVGFMGLACIQLDILKEKIKDKKRHFVEFDNYKSDINIADSFAKNYEIRKHLENCIEHHLGIIRFVDETERVFGYSALIQFAATTLIICVVAFKMTTLQMSVELLSMVFYMMCMVMEAFIYCYYGNELIVKSEEITEAAYESLWYEHTLENRKLVFILMERSKRPLKVSASIFILSLATYMSIMKSSYSYYALLRQIDN